MVGYVCIHSLQEGFTAVLSSLCRVLQTIHHHQPLTRRALCDQTGLSPSRAGAHVAQLTAHEVVCEDLVPDGTPGRPAALLSINPIIGRVVGLDIGGRHSRAVLSDMTGAILDSVVHPTHAVPEREVILGNITRLVEAVCHEGETRPDRLAALGVGVQGIVNTRTGKVLDWPNTPEWAEGWKGMNVASELGQRLGCELIVVDDSVRAMASAALRFGQAQDSTNFLYVFLGNGIGCGVYVNGRPYAGSSGIAGELGHVNVDEGGPWCSCGSRGCLEVMASTSALLRRARERLAEPRLMSTLRDPFERNELTLSAMIEAASAGDKLAFQVLDETGAYVGKVLAIALNLFGPELVVLGGPLAQADCIILEAVQRQVRLHALQYVSTQTRIVCDDLGELTGARGSALRALDELFSSERHLAKLLGQLSGTS